MNETNWVDSNEAMDIVQKEGIPCTRTSFLNWIQKYELGKKVGGRWYVDKIKLLDWLKK